jgi:hypothetical protein
VAFSNVADIEVCDQQGSDKVWMAFNGTGMTARR